MNSAIGAGRPTLVSADIPNNAANTTGKSAKTDALNSASTVVNVSAATAPSVGQVLTATDSTHATWQAVSGAGLGDVSGPASSVDSEVAIFSGTGGKTLKRASASGIAKVTSGVLSAVAAPAGAIVGDTDSQTLTNKTLNLTSNTLVTTSAQLAAAVTDETGSGALVFGTSPTIATPIIASLANAQHSHLNAAGGGILTVASLSDHITKRAAADFSVTTSTTLVNVTGLTATLTAGLTYRFRAALYCSCDAAGGASVAVSGTCTATAVVGQINYWDNGGGAALPGLKFSALNTSSQLVSTDALIEVVGTITVNAGGTLTIQFAQASSSGVSTVQRGSTLEVEAIA